MRTLLSLDRTRRSPLLEGPYVSLSRPFRQGAPIDALIAGNLLHPHLRERIPKGITHLHGHQERAIRAIAAGRTTLVSTGTGSGKTECFLYPIVSRCLHLRDGAAPPGISAVIVYPMNALAEDQLMRLRALLAGTGIPFGLYVGKTPEGEAEVAGVQLPADASRADYEARLEGVRRAGSGETVYPPEEVCSREAMRTPGRQPRILLTNVKQLELLLTRQQDVEPFADPKVSPSRGAPVSLSGERSRLDADVPMPWRIDGETLPMSRRCAPAHLTEAGAAVEVLPVHRQLEKTLMIVEDEPYPERLNSGHHSLSDAPQESRDSVSTDPIGKQRERNQKAGQFPKYWMLDDAESESGTWELLKSELDRDRSSGRKPWLLGYPHR